MGESASQMSEAGRAGIKKSKGTTASGRGKSLVLRRLQRVAKGRWRWSLRREGWRQRRGPELASGGRTWCPRRELDWMVEVVGCAEEQEAERVLIGFPCQEDDPKAESDVDWRLPRSQVRHDGQRGRGPG